MAALPWQPQEPRELFLLLPKGRHTSLHPNDYLSLGALTNSRESLPAAAIPLQQGSRAGWCQPSRALSPGLWYRKEEGEAAPLLTNKLSEVLLGLFTTGKPNTLDILVICCEIVS